MAYNIFDEAIELVPNSPESDSERSFPTMEEEALKIADYLLTDKFMRSGKIVPRHLALANGVEEESSGTESDCDDIPTANLLHLSPACVAKRTHRRTIVTEELQNMFGFEATPLTAKRKTVRKRPTGSESSDVSIEQTLSSENGSGDIFSKRISEGKALASVSSRNQPKPVKHQTKSVSNKRDFLDVGSIGPQANRRVTRRSVLLAEQTSKQPIKSKTDPVRKGGKINNGKAASRAGPSRVNTGCSSTTSKASDAFSSSVSALSQTITIQPPVTPRRVTAKVDTGRKSRVSLKPGIVTMATPNSTISIPSTPIRVATYSNVKSKIDTGNTPRRASSVATKHADSQYNQTPGSTRPTKQVGNSANLSKRTPTISVQDRTLATKSLNSRAVSNPHSDQLFKKPQGVNMRTTRRSVSAGTANQENATSVTTRRRSTRLLS